MTHQSFVSPNRYVGALVLTGFGTGWLVWSWASEGTRSMGALLLICMVGIGLAATSLVRLIRARRQDASPAGARRARARLWFSVTVLVEGAAIYFGGGALSRRGLEDWIGPAVILVVGLHFLPLAKIFRYKPYVWTGLALVLIGGALPWLLSDGPGSPVLALCSGLVLWLSAGSILFPRLRPAPTSGRTRPST